MKKFITLLLMLNSIFCFSQDQKTVINLFKKKLVQVDSVFKNTPTFLITEDFPKSNSKKLNYLMKLVKIESSYDIQKTTSLVSPYTALIILKLQIFSNVGFGNIESGGQIYGFETEEQARKVDPSSSCTGNAKYDSVLWCIGEIKINYALQNGKWVFKNVDTETENKIQNGSSRRHIQIELPKILN